MDAIQKLMDDFEKALEPHTNEFINQTGAISGNERFPSYFITAVQREFEQVYDRYVFEAPFAQNVSTIEQETIEVSDDVPRNAQTDNQSIQVMFDSINDPTNLPSTSSFGQSGNQTAKSTNDAQRGQAALAPNGSIYGEETIKITDDVERNAQTENQSIPVMFDSINDPTNLPSTSSFGQSGNQTAKSTNDEDGIPSVASTSAEPMTKKRGPSSLSTVSNSKKQKTGASDEDDGVVYKCPIEGCSSSGHTSTKGFKQHQTKAKHFMCSECRTAFKEKIVFVAHLRSAHHDGPPPSLSESDLISKNNEFFKILDE